MISFRQSLLTALVLLAAPAIATAAWRHVGTSALDLRLNGLATGPMDRVAWSADGTILYARATAGQWFAMGADENWRVVFSAPGEQPEERVDRIPEPGARVFGGGRAGYFFAVGVHVWRSEDAGRSWRNLTQWRQGSLLGGPVASLAVRPNQPDQIVVAGTTGVWRSSDAGLSWTSQNEGLPHLPLRRIVSLPKDTAGLRVALAAQPGVAPQVFEWAPGERTAWQEVPGLLSAEYSVRAALSRDLGTTITAVASSGDVIYAGGADGRIWVSLDRGVAWQSPAANPGGSVEGFTIDAREPRRALACLRRESAGPVVVRTINGGMFWDDISANLPENSVYGVSADYLSGIVYAATRGGLYQSASDLTALAPPAAWRKVETGLPAAPVFDVRLDAMGQNLYLALYGFGIYTDTAPHRSKELKLVSAADGASRPAAPGALLSVLGGRLQSARAGDKSAPVVHATERETQIQLPYDLEGDVVTLTLQGESGSVSSSLPLLPSAPAILVDRDGSPMMMDGQTGTMLDAGNPARAGSTVQLLASGLGRVVPEWPAGIPAPAAATPEDLPVVQTPVSAWLDGVKIEVVRATLAPGYVGYYLVEVRLPDVVNAGPSELYLEMGNYSTNKVRLYLEP